MHDMLRDVSGTNGVPLSIVVQAAIAALLKYVSTPASRNPPQRDIRFVDITASTVDMFQHVLLQQVYPGVAVATSGRVTRPSDDMRRPLSGPPAAAAAVGDIKTKLKSEASSFKSDSSSSTGKYADKIYGSPFRLSSSSLAAAAVSGQGQGQRYVDRYDRQRVPTTPHDNYRLSPPCYI